MLEAVPESLSDVDVPALIARYAASAQIAGRLTPVRRQNEAANDVAHVYSELVAKGPEALDALIPLLDHSAPSVRGWAAAHPLLHRPSLAEAVLEAMASERGLESFTARWTLRTWRKGELRFTRPELDG
jgi:hypothetical protein